MDDQKVSITQKAQKLMEESKSWNPVFGAFFPAFDFLGSQARRVYVQVQPTSSAL